VIDTAYNLLYYMEDGKCDDNLNQPFGTDPFDSEMVEVALVYHRELAHRQAKGYVPVEVRAFIAGACWAKQVLLGGRNKRH
jgi:hypothetical protein